MATGGQCEIDQRFNTLVKSADNMMKYKFVVKSVANQYGKSATFMPKPIFGDNGSGMHTHQSLWAKGKPLFAGEKYAGLSQMALNYAGMPGTARLGCSVLRRPPTFTTAGLIAEAPVNLAVLELHRSGSGSHN